MLTSETYLEPTHDGPFLRKYSTAKIRYLFSPKSSITDFRLVSKYASKPYMTYLSKTCVSTKKMVAGLAHKKKIKKQHVNI